MREIYRVVPWDRRAKAAAPGHATFVSRNSQGRGRIDNPDLYGVFYASSRPVGAIAERFADLRSWTSVMLRSPRGFPYAVAAYLIPSVRLLDLDDARTLLERQIRPSRVVTRQREATQSWSREIWHERKWDGVSWWSYHDPDWVSIGLWETKRLRVSGQPQPLTLDHPLLIETAERLGRRIESR